MMRILISLSLFVLASCGPAAQPTPATPQDTPSTAKTASDCTGHSQVDIADKSTYVHENLAKLKAWLEDASLSSSAAVQTQWQERIASVEARIAEIRQVETGCPGAEVDNTVTELRARYEEITGTTLP